MFVITDEDGNYLNRLSFKQIDVKGNKCVYITYSGKLGTDFFGTKNNAEIILKQLQNTNKEIHAGKTLHITKVDVDDLDIGTKIITNIDLLNRVVGL